MDSVHAEKAAAMRRYRRIKRITTAIRCIEALTAIVILSWSSTKIPNAVRIAADALRRISAIIVSHGFIFILGNAIVALLVAKSGNITDETSGDLYDQVLDARGRTATQSDPATEPAAEATALEDKEVCVETKMEDTATKGRRVCRRSKSERRRSVEVVKELRRSETNLGRRSAAAVEHDKDADEFRRTIEAFIEKRNLFLREESMAIVCSAGTTQHEEDGILNEKG